MKSKDILLLLDLAHPNSPSLQVAVDLARQCGAHLTGLALAVDPIVPGFVIAPIPVEMIEAAREEAMKTADEAVIRFEAAARLADISREARVAEVLLGGIPQSFVAASRLSDLVVIGQDDPDNPEPLRDVLVETALFDGVAPLLIVPYIAKAPLKPDRVIIAWDGSRPAARAARAALQFLSPSSEVTVLMIGSARDQPGEPGADLATWLARHGLDVSVKCLSAGTISIADTILNYAADNGFDLVVMGGYGHSWMREALIGGATRDILRTMTVPVLMAH